MSSRCSAPILPVKRWVIQEGKSEIEIAPDRGAEVKAGEHQEPICELELELLAGETADLLRLAHRLLESGVLRQGSSEQAARGYHLAQGNNERPVTWLAGGAAGGSEGQRGAGAGGGCWRAPWRTLAVSRRDLAARQRKSQSGNSAGDSPRAPCPRAVWRHRCRVRRPPTPRVAERRRRRSAGCGHRRRSALFRTEVVGAKLALTEWLVQRGWRPFLNEAEREKIAGSFKRFRRRYSPLAGGGRAAQRRAASGDRRCRWTSCRSCPRDIDLASSCWRAPDGDAVAPWLENWQGTSARR